VLYRHSFCKISREVDVNAVHNRKMITQQLQRDHIQQSLKSINRSGDFHLGQFLRKIGVALVTSISTSKQSDLPNEDWFAAAGGDLFESRVDFGVQVILGDDKNDTHLFVDHCR